MAIPIETTPTIVVKKPQAQIITCTQHFPVDKLLNRFRIKQLNKRKHQHRKRTKHNQGGTTFH